MLNKRKMVFQIGLFCIGLSFIFYGVYRGEVSTVFSKAIKLCMECVGIG